MKYFVLAALLLSLLSVSAAAAPPDTLRVPARVSPAVVKIGERIDVRFTFLPPKGSKQLHGPPAPLEVGPVDVLLSEAVPASGDSLGWHLQAAFFQTGELNLSGIPFVLDTEEGEVPVRLAPYVVSVVSSLPDSLTEADIREIRGPVETPLRWRWGRVAAAAALLAVAALGVLWWRRRGQGIEPAVPYVPAIPADLEALRALRNLEDAALPAQGRLKDHYAELSLILRRYLERRFRFPAVESTTFEIADSLQRSPLSTQLQQNLLPLLEQSDLVKFAKARPTVESATAALEQGAEWVRKTAAPPVAGDA